MWKLIRIFLTFMLLSLSTISLAQQSGGGDNTGVQETCEVSGGTFTGSEAGNWACCWSDWGCYGCVDGNCKMNCKTKRCRKANGMSHANTTDQTVEGLAPKGLKAPVAPSKKLNVLQ